MNDRILYELDKEIDATKAQLARLLDVRKTLVGPTQNGTGKRAPKNALEDAVQNLLKAHPNLTNGEIRARLKKEGYAYSLASLHVGKRLMALVDQKKLGVKLDGADRRYHLAR